MEWLLALAALAVLTGGGAVAHRSRKKREQTLSHDAASAEVEIELRSFIDVGESALRQAKQIGRANHWELLGDLSESAGAEIERAQVLALDAKARQAVARAVKLKAQIDRALTTRHVEKPPVERVVYVPAPFAPPPEKPPERKMEYE